MTKLGEVFAVPTEIRMAVVPGNADYWLVIDAKGYRISAALTKPQALALAEAINTHDRMREALERANQEVACNMKRTIWDIPCEAFYTETNPITGKQEPCACCAIRAALAREGEKE